MPKSPSTLFPQTGCRSCTPSNLPISEPGSRANSRPGEKKIFPSSLAKAQGEDVAQRLTTAVGCNPFVGENKTPQGHEARSRKYNLACAYSIGMYNDYVIKRAQVCCGSRLDHWTMCCNHATRYRGNVRYNTRITRASMTRC